MKFRADIRPEDNIQLFFEGLIRRDPEIGSFLADKMSSLFELGRNRTTGAGLRATIANEAIELIRARLVSEVENEEGGTGQ